MNKCRLKQIFIEALAVVTLISGILMIGSLFAGCSNEEENLTKEIAELKAQTSDLKLEIIQLEDEKSQLEKQIENIKVEHDIAKYIITINITQKHPWYDIENNIKDSMNDISLQIPVDKEYYNSLEIGDVLDDSFRMGSLIMSSSIGSWNITITDKEIR